MGQLEKEFTKRRKRADVQRLVLKSVAVAGLLGVAVVAPNVISAMQKLGLVPSRRQKEVIFSARRRLEEKGLLARHADGAVSLTAKGEKELRRIEMMNAPTKPRRWDKRWRVLVFDIPEHRRGARDKIRKMLMQIGYVRLQHSVWVYPYATDDVIALLKADLGIGKQVLYLVVDTLEGDAWLKKHFNLR